MNGRQLEVKEGWTAQARVIYGNKCMDGREGRIDLV